MEASDFTPRSAVIGGGDAQAVIDAAVASTDLKPIEISEGHQLAALVPDGYRVERFNLDEFEYRPLRQKGVYRPATVESFVGYVEAHRTEGESTVWVHPTAGRIVAVLNDSEKDLPGWGDYRAELTLIPTDQWKHWLAKDGQLLDQEVFAEHLEDGIGEIVNPPAADLLEVAQSFHATTSATIRSAKRLDSGQVTVLYDEKIDASAGTSGEMTIPQEFELAIAPFVGEEPYRIKARLRYRLRSGALSIGYKLDRPNEVVQDALAKIAERLAGQFDRVYTGEPASR
jgi:uncharacterized protein YfdQ (DUF2303 family)